MGRSCSRRGVVALSLVLLGSMVSDAGAKPRPRQFRRAWEPVPIQRSTASQNGTVMVKTMGYHRRRDSGIWVWRGNRKKMRTLVHELLHRSTRHRPEAYRGEIRHLTGDRAIDEGLTSYFTKVALSRAGRSEVYPDPAPGSSFGQLRRWARGIRNDARSTIHDAFGVQVDTKKIAILSDNCFGRCYRRDFGKLWASRPGQPGVYGNSRSKVEQMVNLVGEGPVRRAYFQGDVAGLRSALGRIDPAHRPGWINLGLPPAD